MPVVFPLSLVAVVWVLIYAPGPNGMMNVFLELVSFGAWTPRDFLHDPLPGVAGHHADLDLAGYRLPDGHPACRPAGHSRPSSTRPPLSMAPAAGRRFWHVTLPQLRNTLIFVVLVTTILAFRLFDQVQIMTQGGPHDATTTVMFEAVEAAFARQQVARGAAMTVVLFLVVLLISWLQRRVARQEREVT